MVRAFMLGEKHPLAEWEEIFEGADVSGDISRFPDVALDTRPAGRIMAA